MLPRSLLCTVCHSAGCRRYFLGGLFLLALSNPPPALRTTPYSTFPFWDRLNPIRRLDLAFVRLSTTTGETIGLHGNHECPVPNVPLVSRLQTAIAIAPSSFSIYHRYPSFRSFREILNIIQHLSYLGYNSASEIPRYISLERALYFELESYNAAHTAYWGAYVEHDVKRSLLHDLLCKQILILRVNVNQ